MADLKNNNRVAVNGYGVIGKRVAAAVAVQEDMSLAGVSDVVTDRARHRRRRRRPSGRKRGDRRVLPDG